MLLRWVSIRESNSYRFKSYHGVRWKPMTSSSTTKCTRQQNIFLCFSFVDFRQKKKKRKETRVRPKFNRIGSSRRRRRRRRRRRAARRRGLWGWRRGRNCAGTGRTTRPASRCRRRSDRPADAVGSSGPCTPSARRNCLRFNRQNKKKKRKEKKSGSENASG